MAWRWTGNKPLHEPMKTVLSDANMHPGCNVLTNWGRMTGICDGEITIIGSDNGLSPGRRQAIIWTNAGILFIRIAGTNFSEIVSEVNTFSFKKTHLNMSSAKWHPFSSASMCKQEFINMHASCCSGDLRPHRHHQLIVSVGDLYNRCIVCINAVISNRPWMFELQV